MSAFPIKLQFFLTYGVLGSISPIAALVLKDAKGFDPRQVAVTLSLPAIGLLISPAVMAWLADREFDSRKILRVLFAAAAGSLALVFFCRDAWAITAAWAAYSILFIPTLPLLDGYYFIHEREHGGGALHADGSYQFVRVWGTIGFMVPSAALYFIIHATGDVGNALWCAVAWCGFSLVGTYLLNPCNIAQAGRIKAPTRRAMKVLFSRATLPMCLGLFFVYVAANAYYPVLSVFLTEEVGIAQEWVSLLMSLGVAIEVGYILGLGPIRRLLRIRGILIFGLSTMALRLAALAFFPTVATALIIQLFHGFEILAMFVVPVIYLDRVAGDGFRNSIQGAFAIVVTVPTRVLGFVLAGEIRESTGSTGAVLYTASGLAAIGMLTLLFFFKPKPAPVATAAP